MALWRAEQPLVLASKSQVRRGVLEAAGVPVEVKPASIDERAVEARAGRQSADDIARVLARSKAHAVGSVHPDRYVLGADQTLALGQRRFSKACSRAEAREQLRALRGKTHSLHSAVAIAHGGEIVFEHVDSAHLTVRAFSDAFLESYLDAIGEAAMASVGAYQVEGAGIQLFDRIEGDHFTILGLPLLPLLAWLRGAGLLES